MEGLGLGKPCNGRPSAGRKHSNAEASEFESGMSMEPAHEITLSNRRKRPSCVSNLTQVAAIQIAGACPDVSD
jgi:hypothetical protein